MRLIGPSRSNHDKRKHPFLESKLIFHPPKKQIYSGYYRVVCRKAVSVAADASPASIGVLYR